MYIRTFSRKSGSSIGQVATKVIVTGGATADLMSNLTNYFDFDFGSVAA